MSSAFLSVTAVWADPDLIEIAVDVQHRAWGGTTKAYVTRDELRVFATDLALVVEGHNTAAFNAGQRNLGYANLTIREYDRARRLLMDVVLGQSGDGNVEGTARELRVTVPIERGGLAEFRERLRRIADTDAGEAMLVLLP